MLYMVYFNSIILNLLSSLVSTVYENITAITGETQLQTLTSPDTRNKYPNLTDADSRDQLPTLSGADNLNQFATISTLHSYTYHISTLHSSTLHTPQLHTQSSTRDFTLVFTLGSDPILDSPSDSSLFSLRNRALTPHNDSAHESTPRSHFTPLLESGVWIWKHHFLRSFNRIIWIITKNCDGKPRKTI